MTALAFSRPRRFTGRPGADRNDPRGNRANLKPVATCLQPSAGTLAHNGSTRPRHEHNSIPDAADLDQIVADAGVRSVAAASAPVTAVAATVRPRIAEAVGAAIEARTGKIAPAIHAAVTTPPQLIAIG